ncbi:MAG: LysR family transcriptional regulator [Magnetococcales bacterium]|nr:LysR family transcriptional regulator [Magnetococcales bacterium]
MDRLTLLETFVTVAEVGTLTGAARSMGISKGAVSKYLGALEESMEVRLMQRTTRRLTLTEEGRSLLPRAIQMVADWEESKRSLGQMRGAVRGRLKVSAPLSFGLSHLSRALVEFMGQHPELEVELDLTDRYVDLLEEGFDLVIRVGKLVDSSLMAKRLTSTRGVVCASPDYLKRQGTPQTPEELTRHRCLIYTGMMHESIGVWRFENREGGIHRIKVRGPFKANNGDVLRAAALQGQGITISPTFIIGQDLKAGRLLPILTRYRLPEMGIHALYPHQRHLSARVRALIDYLGSRWKAHPDWEG